MRFAPPATILAGVLLAATVALPSGGAIGSRLPAAASKAGVVVAKRGRSGVATPDCRMIEVAPGQSIRACAVSGPRTVRTPRSPGAAGLVATSKRAKINKIKQRRTSGAALPTSSPGTGTLPTTTFPPGTQPVAVTQVPVTSSPPSLVATVDPVAATTTTFGPVPPPTLAAISTISTISTTPTIPASTTTIPTPFPAAATPMVRATAGTLDAYRGLGTWADVFDWTVQFSGVKNPKFTPATVDALAANGVQTLYIQTSKWDSKSGDIPEVARLQPILDRAHQLGLFVVAWYLPTLEDVNADLRRTVASAQLDVDGVSIDIETSRVKDIPTRNQRLLEYSNALRALLPGRLITGTVLPPVDTDSPTYKLWPKLPYGSISGAYDGWVIMGYWTSWKPESGWRDGYRYTQENINRLRAYLGRPDAPIHYAGGVGGKALTPWDVGGMIRASQEAGILGASVYDWLVTDPSYWQYLWALRTVSDPRWTPVAAPPPPTTTTTSTTVPSTVPGSTIAPVDLPSTTTPLGPETGGNANVVVVATIATGH